MICAACGTTQAVTAKFCPECGAPVVRRCANCKHELAANAKFCPECGTAVTSTAASKPAARRVADYTPKHLAEKILQSRSALEGERKQVTVLFCDIKGSMALAGRIDAEDWHGILDRFFQILSDGVHRFEGTINQYTGDGVMALFGAPIAHEDHAQRACYAAAQLREELRAYGVELRKERGLDFGVRIGINSGEVVVGRIGDDLRMDYTAQGHTVGLAQRLEQLCETGHVYLSEHTARLVSGYFDLVDLGPFKLHGETGSVGVYDLEKPTRARTRLQVSRARGLTRFVGRNDEMQALRVALERARAGHGQVVGVVGEPGLGKSRLCYEFVAECRAQGLTVHEGHCPSYGKTIPFIPVLELFRSYFDIAEDDPPLRARQKVAGTLLLLDPTLQDALSTLFEFMGIGDPGRPAPPLDAEVRQRQLFDMLHKVVRAQSARGVLMVTFVDDLHWVDGWSEAYIAQLADAMEHSHGLLLVNFRPEYGVPWHARAHYQQLPLVPLGEAAVREMVLSLLGEDASVNPLVERILAWTGGNPLFSEEVINTLTETGQLVGTRGTYRLSRAVDELEVPATVQAIIAARIDRLDEQAKHLLHIASVIGKEFSAAVIERVCGIAPHALSASMDRLKALDFVYQVALYPMAEYSFKHPLVHEVAYETQLRAQRTVSHRRVAQAIEALEAARLDEMAATLAYHWERAGDDVRAIEWHRRAGRIAQLNDPRSAVHHWTRVRQLIDSETTDPALLEVGAEACERLITLGWRLGGSEADAERQFDDGRAMARRAKDDTRLALLTGAYSAYRGPSTGDAGDYARYGEEAYRIAEATGDLELQCSMAGWQAAGLWFTGRLEECLALCERITVRMPPDPEFGMRYTNLPARCLLDVSVGGSLAWLGRLAAAQACLQATYPRITLPEPRVYCSSLEAFLVALIDDVEKGIALGVRSVADAEESGTGLARAGATSFVAAMHYRVGRVEDAERLLLRCVDVMGREHSGAIQYGMTMGTLACIETERGDHERARERARDAIAFCMPRKLFWSLDPWFALARAEIALDHRDAARDALDEAAALVEQTSAAFYRPHLRECRAAYAQRFSDTWQVDAEIEAACRALRDMGIREPVERFLRFGKTGVDVTTN